LTLNFTLGGILVNRIHFARQHAPGKLSEPRGIDNVSRIAISWESLHNKRGNARSGFSISGKSLIMCENQIFFCIFPRKQSWTSSEYGNLLWI